jgi:hypothetical protein
VEFPGTPTTDPHTNRTSLGDSPVSDYEYYDDDRTVYYGVNVREIPSAARSKLTLDQFFSAYVKSYPKRKPDDRILQTSPVSGDGYSGKELILVRETPAPLQGRMRF